MFKTNFFLKKSISYRLLCITFSCFVLGLIFSAHIQPVKSGSEQSAVSAPEVDGTPTPTPTPEIPHTLAGSFYTTKDNIEAKLLLNNKGAVQLEVQPTLYNLQGQELQLPPVFVEPNSFRFIDLAEWAAIGGESFRSGNIRLFHYGPDLVLGTQIYLTHEAKSLSFEEKLVELGKFDSHRQEGVWWMPSNDADVEIILTNTTGAPLTVTGRLAKKPNHVSDPQTVNLAPHETKTINLREDFPGSGPYLNSDILGLSLEHAGAASALLARAMVYEKTHGYSNIVQFSNPGGGKSSEYQGVGFQIENIAGQELTAVIAVRNVGTQTATITARVPYTKANGAKSTIALPQETLQAGKMKLLNTAGIIQRVRQQQIEVASLEIEYDTAPGSVIAAAHTLSNNHNQVFRVPMWDPLGQRSPTGGYPWRIEGTSVTETYIRNITDQEQDYVAFLIWEGGGEYMIGLKPLAGRETVHIDIKKLRNEQIPDERGHVIPLSVSKGQFQWTLRRKDNLPEDDVRANLALIGRTEQVDLEKGTVNNYACQNTCVGTYAGGYVIPGNSEVNFGDVIQYEAHEEGLNYGYFYDYVITNAEWSSENTAAATVNSSGLATTHAGGATKIKARWRIMSQTPTEPCGGGGPYRQTDPGENTHDCEREQSKGKKTRDGTANRPPCGSCMSHFYYVSPDSNLTVRPQVSVQSIEYKVGTAWNAMPSGGLGPICNGTSVTFRAIPSGGTFPAGQPTWGGDASGSGAEVSVTFSSGGSRTVTATAGTSAPVSANVNVGAANGNISVTWLAPNTTTSSGSGSSTTGDAPFVPEYNACADLGDQKWRLRMKKIEGRTNISIMTGGYRNVSTSPPVNSTEATDSVSEMNAYYPNGQVQNWHTPAASTAHENHHNSEWQCSADHYWPQAETALELKNVAYGSYADETAAINAMKTGTSGATALVDSFKTVSKTYWNSLADNASSRPYAVGQLVLNGQITTVIALATTNSWASPGSVANASPTTTPVCYAAFAAWTP